ncbi:172_t:CDS:2 [Funneliformis caledonium]|uniref:172_t:CDS:1 n=1 Tax=Funneliformis caledonium TaxID=1117310 RepID=A0A9N8W1P9_9GLOM|nr:172_t:CDS:2 [Funneliformis caledonium]
MVVLTTQPMDLMAKSAMFAISTGVYVPKNYIINLDIVILHYELAKVVGNGQVVDIKNDVYTVIEAYGTSVSAGSPVSFNTIVEFKHQATGGINRDDDWLIRRFSSNTSKDDPDYLLDGDIISLIHDNTDKPALYSHLMLFSDGSQEVSCHENGYDENNMWRIELIDDS